MPEVVVRRARVGLVLPPFLVSVFLCDRYRPYLVLFLFLCLFTYDPADGLSTGQRSKQ